MLWRGILPQCAIVAGDARTLCSYWLVGVLTGAPEHEQGCIHSRGRSHGEKDSGAQEAYKGPDAGF